jgi:uncharacterized protein (TIGR02808 family)
MGTLETIIWQVLGYSAMPVILLVGYLITVGIGCVLLDLTGRSSDD